MTGLLIFIHVVVCLFLIFIILMQSGRGGGLTENFSSVENIFGAKTNETLIKGTTVLAALFLLTCLSLAFLSSKKSQSLMADRRVNSSQTPAPASEQKPVAQPASAPEPAPSVPAAETQPAKP